MGQPKDHSPTKETTKIDAGQVSIDASKMDNAVLKRLIGEIDFEKENRLHAYNRTHNRHNRGR